jgi:endonuclease III
VAVQAGIDMKNSKDYSKKVQALYRTLSRKHAKVEIVNNEHVTDAIIYAIVSSALNEKPATSAVKRLAEHFVDWNDLRVSRTEEIVDVLHKDTQATRKIAATLVEILNGIFNQHHQVSLDALKKAGKRPARQAIENIEGITRFAVDYCMLTSLQGHAIPLTDKMLDYLRNNELVDHNADEQQVGGFLAKQIPAKNGYDFYALLRHESETAKSTKKKAKKKDKPATKKKTKTSTKANNKVKKTKKKTVRRKKA